MLKNKKGYIDHPVVAILVGFLVGALVMYLVAKGIIPVNIPVC